MQSSPNLEKYKSIFEKKNSNPSLPLSALCEENGVSYQSYNNWFKKHKADAVDKSTSANKVKITSFISIVQLVDLITRGVTEIPITVEALVRSLNQEDKSRLAQQMGARQLEQIAKAAFPGETN